MKAVLEKELQTARARSLKGHLEGKGRKKNPRYLQLAALTDIIVNLPRKNYTKEKKNGVVICVRAKSLCSHSTLNLLTAPRLEFLRDQMNATRPGQRGE